MIDELNVDVSSRVDAPVRVLAIYDHLDTPGDWLTSSIVASMSATRATAVLALERAPRDILERAHKVHKRNRRCAANAHESKTLVFIDRTIGEHIRGLASEVAEATARALESGKASGVRGACVVIDGVDSAFLASGMTTNEVETFLDSCLAIGGEVDLVVCAHADACEVTAWVEENADCEIRLEPLKTGSAEDAHGTWVTTHMTNAFRAVGAPRRSRGRYVLSELGVSVSASSASAR